MPQPRYGYRRTFSSDNFPPVLKWLIIVNVVVYVVDFLFGGMNIAGATLHDHVRAIFGLSAFGVTNSFFVWQLVTYMFVHGGLMHLLFNMLTLWFFGTTLERDWGSRQFLKYYLYCGIAAGVCVLIADFLTRDSITIGASGAIFGVLVAFGVLYPNQTVLMSFLFPIRAKYMVMIYAAIELLLTFGPNSGISTIAHLGGMAFGYVYLKGRLPKAKLRLPNLGAAYKQWKLQRAKKKFQVYMRKHGNGPWVN
jgi:membrane associated rhomboid family serine protease